MDDVRLVVGGRRYGGWKKITIIQSVESVSGSFSLEVSDRWEGQGVPWPIAEESPCKITISGANGAVDTVISGFVDRRTPAHDANGHRLAYSGRDSNAVLVDCSALLDKWTFRKASVLDVARKLAAPYGVAVSLQAGLALPAAPEKFVVAPGERAFDALRRAAAPSGVLIIGDGAGGIMISRAGKVRADALVLGQNIKVATGEFSSVDRYRRYVVLSQKPGRDSASGAATRIRGEATDLGVVRENRVLVIRPSAGMSNSDAQRRADWEARIRAARAEAVNITVTGWRQDNGRLWAPNELSRVEHGPLGIKGDMLISQVTRDRGPGGTTTVLRLVRPDAFTPSPTATVKKATGSRGWKEPAGVNK